MSKAVAPDLPTLLLVLHLVESRTDIDKLAVNSHGQALISTTNTLHLYATVDDLMALRPPEKTYELPSETVLVTQLVAGAAHFLVHSSDGVVYSLSSDNRFGQTGRREKNTSELKSIQFFEGLNVTQVATGDFHSAVVADGALYMFGGPERNYQPMLVDFEVDVGEEQPDVAQVALGANHTVVLTEDGRVYVSGDSEHFVGSLSAWSE